jgi:hypothetical protein
MFLLLILPFIYVYTKNVCFQKERNRPIMWACHDLGGSIVKQVEFCPMFPLIAMGF